MSSGTALQKSGEFGETSIHVDHVVGEVVVVGVVLVDVLDVERGVERNADRREGSPPVQLVQLSAGFALPLGGGHHAGVDAQTRRRAGVVAGREVVGKGISGAA